MTSAARAKLRLDKKKAIKDLWLKSGGNITSDEIIAKLNTNTRTIDKVIAGLYIHQNIEGLRLEWDC